MLLFLRVSVMLSYYLYDFKKSLEPFRKTQVSDRLKYTDHLFIVCVHHFIAYHLWLFWVLRCFVLFLYTVPSLLSSERLVHSTALPCNVALWLPSTPVTENQVLLLASDRFKTHEDDHIHTIFLGNWIYMSQRQHHANYRNSVSGYVYFDSKSHVPFLLPSWLWAVNGRMATWILSLRSWQRRVKSLQSYLWI